MATDIPYWTIASVILGLLLVLPSIMGFFGKNKFDVNGKTVLLTGASQGMGKSVAIQLAAKGANVIIVARNVAKLEEVLTQVKASAVNATQQFQYISSDLTDPESASKVIAEAVAWNNGRAPDVVWCMAGRSTPGLFLETSRSARREEMAVNYWSCADMAHAILTEWLAPSSVGKGTTKHLIFTSSVAAFYPITGYSSYGPGKAAIKTLSDGLAQEVLLYGEEVKIHTVFPGGIQSPGFEIENKTKPQITHILEASDTVQMPDEVAKNAIRGLENGDYLITVDFLGSVMRACAWGCSRRNNWVIDTLFTWVISIVWFFAQIDMDGKVRDYGKKNGHPSTYVKNA